LSALLLAGLLLTLLGCERLSEVVDAEGEEAQAVETIEIGGPPDSSLSTTSDIQAPTLANPGVSGVIPAGFPEGLPLYQPSTVVDSGGTDGGRYVVFQADEPPAVVRVGLLAEWEQAGWRSAGRGSYRRGSRKVELKLTAQGSGSNLRIDY